MECRLQGICKFCQQADPQDPGLIFRFHHGAIPAGSTELRDNPPEPVVRRPEPTVKRTDTHKKHMGGGNIVDKEQATMRHCKKCAFTCAGKYVLANHYQVAHPKKKTAAKRTYNPRGGQLTSGMGLDKGNLEESTTGLKINKDKDVRHAFDILQARSNDSTLSKTAQKEFDKLEDETADLTSITEWPVGIRGRVIRLYNDVVNGVTDGK